jgi:hypothetical protein
MLFIECIKLLINLNYITFLQKKVNLHIKVVFKLIFLFMLLTK